MAFSDEELEEFYRRVEALTAASRPPVRIRGRVEASSLRGCPTPYKDAYATERLAHEAIAVGRRLRPNSPVLRTYRCECRRWHITSSPERPTPFDTDVRRGRSNGRGRRKR